MKIKKLLTLLMVPFVCACQQVPEYKGPKLVLDYVENGGLNEINPTQLYDLVITRGKDSFVLFSVEGCLSCEQAKTDLNSYGIGYHMNFYYVNMSTIEVNSNEYLKIVNTTTYLDSLYAFPEADKASYPLVYFFKERGVALTRQTYLVDALRQYVTTSND